MDGEKGRTKLDYLIDGGEEDCVMRQEHGQRVGDDTQLSPTLGAVQPDHQLGEQTRTKYLHSHY